MLSRGGLVANSASPLSRPLPVGSSRRWPLIGLVLLAVSWRSVHAPRRMHLTFVKHETAGEHRQQQHLQWEQPLQRVTKFVLNSARRCGDGAVRAFCAGPAGRLHLVGAGRRLKGASRVGTRALRWALRWGHGRHQDQALQFAPLFARPGDAPSLTPDVFIFVKDYKWGLRYRVSHMSESALHPRAPLELMWIKLKRPVRDVTKLLKRAKTDDLFDWDKQAPPRHKGFKYKVTNTVGPAMEAVVNLLDGKGLSLLVQPNEAIQLVDRAGNQKGLERSKAAAVRLSQVGGGGEALHPVTHGWVQCLKMPLLPIPKLVAFYNYDEVVMQWKS